MTTTAFQRRRAADVRTIARDAYIYGFPLVDSYRIQHSYFVDSTNREYKGPWNRVHNTARLYGPGDTAVQTPNSDTPYSFIGADLRTEPLVLTLPPIERERYYSAQFIDAYTFNFAYLGSRTTGNNGGSFLLAGPSWKGDAPARVKEVIRCETQLAFVLIRTQLFGPDDLQHVKQIQSGYRVQTLSSFLDRPGPPSAPKLEFVRPLAAEEERTSLEFFSVLDFVLSLCPTHPSEEVLMERFAEMGVGGGSRFDPRTLSAELRTAIRDGMTYAWRAYEHTEARLANGELTSADLFGSRAALEDNYLYRMTGAVDGIYGNSPEEAIYPAYLTDADGERLDASTNRYELRFAPGQLPPVNAFWSMTMYDAATRLLVANPIDRYLINSPMLPDLRRDADGGLTLYLQHTPPGPDRAPNWLPAPNGPFMAALRLYWPKSAALTGAWTKPALRRTT